jgi:hypothetical protein
VKVGPVHAALNGREAFEGKAYLLRDRAYYRYTWDPEETDKGFPVSIARWSFPPKFAAGEIDAALNGEKQFAGAAYFFKGPSYVRYDWPTGVTEPDLRPLTAWNLTGSFLDGVDAACNGREDFDGKAYFFKGDRYSRYDWASGTLDVENASLSAWSLPAPFDAGVDAALEGAGPFAGFVYFFRGNRWVGYNWREGTVSPPQEITGTWRGLGEVLALDPVRAVFYNEHLAAARANEEATRVPALFSLAQAAVETGWSTGKPGNNMFRVRAGPSWTGQRQLLRAIEVFGNANVTGFPKLHRPPAPFQVPAQGSSPPRTMWRYDVDDWFRVYPTVQGSFADRAAFLGRPRFAAAFDPSAPAKLDPRTFADRIVAAGYATSPAYGPVLRARIAELEELASVVG